MAQRLKVHKHTQSMLCAMKALVFTAHRLLIARIGIEVYESNPITIAIVSYPYKVCIN